MPKLLLADPAQSAPLPSASPAAFGALEGQAMDANGRVAQALGQVITEYVDTEARASAVRYEQELQAEANVIALDPDIPGRMGKFEESAKRIYTKHSPKLGGRATYDARAGLATTDLHGRFSVATMADGIKQMQANNAIERDHWATKAAGAETEDEALSYLATAKETLESGSLYLSPADKTIAEQETVAKTIALAATQNPELADGLMQRFGDMLPPETQTKLRGSITTEARYVEAQRVSDLAIDTLGPNASQTDYLRFVRQHAEGQVRTEAEQRVRLHANDQKAAKTAATNQVVEGAWDRIYGGAGLEAIPRGLEHEQEGPMRSWIEARSKAAADGSAFDPETNADTYIPLLQMAESDPAAFAKVNLPASRLELSNAHYNQLDEKQKAIRTGGQGAGKTSPSGASALEIAKKVAVDAGVTGEAWEADYELRAIDAIEARAAAEGRDLTHTEKRETAVNMLAAVPVPDAGWFWFDGSKHVAKLTAADRTAILDQVPHDLEKRAKAALGPSADDVLVRDWIDEWLTLQGVPTDGN